MYSFWTIDLLFKTLKILVFNSTHFEKEPLEISFDLFINISKVFKIIKQTHNIVIFFRKYTGLFAD